MKNASEMWHAVVEFLKRLRPEEDIPHQIARLYESREYSGRMMDETLERIRQLEEVETNLMEEGRASQTIARKRIATKVATARKQIARQHQLANVYSCKMNIADTEIHSLQLLQEGVSDDLPNTETLTDHAVQAQEVLETLVVNSEMAAELIQDQTVAFSEEEEKILAEFDAPQTELAPEVVEEEPQEPQKEALETWSDVNKIRQEA